jgi:hypothetical protein
MRCMKTILPPLLTAVASASLLTASPAASLKLLGQFQPKDGGAEIVSFTPDGHQLATMYSGGKDGNGVQILKLDGNGVLAEEHVLDLGKLFDGKILTLSSVALDPLGRGLGAVVAVPTENSKVQGKLVLFDYRSGALLGETLDVGFHPDCVRFSEDGQHLLVANEGEYVKDSSAPGSLSVVDISGVKEASAEGVKGLTVQTYDFKDQDLAKIRVNEPGIPRHEAVEPEYVVGLDGRAYVTLQENNAIAVFDLKAKRWIAVHSLGTIAQTVDANSQDKKAEIRYKISGMPMPDTLAVFHQDGKVLIATANEGDARPDDFDRIALAAAKLDPEVAASLPLNEIGSLEIAKLDGDTDHDGDIDVPTMFGTRSLSVWDAETGKLVADTGSLETVLIEQDKTLHNIEEGNPGKFDKRSAKKGPEPEALTVGRLGERLFLFAGMERQNGIVMYDITSPGQPIFTAYANTIAQKLVAPECLVFIPGDKNPTGKALLIGGYELNGGGIGVFEVAP